MNVKEERKKVYQNPKFLNKMKKFMASSNWDYVEEESDLQTGRLIFRINRVDYMKLVSIYLSTLNLEMKIRKELAKKLGIKSGFYFITFADPTDGRKMIGKFQFND